MVTSVFADMLQKNARAGTIPTRTMEAQKWVRTTATATMKNPTQVLKKAPAVLQKGAPSNSIIGSMLLFQYEATTSDNLPYWDKFPLVFPFHVTSTGMYGINMHYLPYAMRARLMDALMTVASGPMDNPTTKLKLTYSTLQSAAKNRYFAPCVKHYLNKGLSSNIVTIPPNEWSVALFLPLERFQKATSAQVYKDSSRTIRGR